MPLNQIVDSNAGLVLQFVATRDIKPGEEILYDSGSEWALGVGLERSCEEIRTEKGDEDYKSAAQWSAMNLPQIVTAKEEEESKPYPENLFLGFAMGYDPSIGANVQKEENGVRVKTVSWIDVSSTHASTTWPCSVLERVKTELGADSYTIMLYSHPAFDEDDEDLFHQT